MKKKLNLHKRFSLLLALSMIVSMLPLGIYGQNEIGGLREDTNTVSEDLEENPNVNIADPNVNIADPNVNIADGNITLTTTGSALGFYIGDDESNITSYEGTLNIVGDKSESSNTITIAKGNGHKVKLRNVNISTTSKAPMLIEEATGDVTVYLEGENLLTASGDFAALMKTNDANLTITSFMGNGFIEGKLEVKASDGAGIGGGKGGRGYNITINGGTITAVSSNTGAGIGGGNGGAGSNITINGGTITASSSSVGAGIGGGVIKGGSNITINGGTITASSSEGAGIGGGKNEAGSNITINGGTITASSRDGAGIGGGLGNVGSNITINGGTITASSRDGAGIGGGWKSSGSDITINGGTITASSSGGGAGIGSGKNGATSTNCVVVRGNNGMWLGTGQSGSAATYKAIDKRTDIEQSPFVNIYPKDIIAKWGKPSEDTNPTTLYFENYIEDSTQYKVKWTSSNNVSGEAIISESSATIFEIIKSESIPAGVYNCVVSVEGSNVNETQKMPRGYFATNEEGEIDYIILEEEPTGETLSSNSTLKVLASSNKDLSYQWKNSNGAIEGAKTASYIANSNGTYHCTISSGETMAIDSNETVVASSNNSSSSNGSVATTTLDKTLITKEGMIGVVVSDRVLFDVNQINIEKIELGKKENGKEVKAFVVDISNTDLAKISLTGGMMEAVSKADVPVKFVTKMGSANLHSYAVKSLFEQTGNGNLNVECAYVKERVLAEYTKSLEIGKKLEISKKIKNNKQLNQAYYLNGKQKDLESLSSTVLTEYSLFVNFYTDEGTKLEVDKASREGKVSAIAIEIPVGEKDKSLLDNAVLGKFDKNGKATRINFSGVTSDGNRVKALTFGNSEYAVMIMNNQAVYNDTENHWSEKNIDFMTMRGVMADGGEEFSPDAKATRVEVITALGQLAQIDTTMYSKNEFTDVSGENIPYVSWAKEKGIISGKTPTSFAPNDFVSREEMSVILEGFNSAMNFELPNIKEKQLFSDQEDISPWAVEQVSKIQQSGLMNGKENNKFDPKGNTTKGELATILTNYVKAVLA